MKIKYQKKPHDISNNNLLEKEMITVKKTTLLLVNLNYYLKIKHLKISHIISIKRKLIWKRNDNCIKTKHLLLTFKAVIYISLGFIMFIKKNYKNKDF